MNQVKKTLSVHSWTFSRWYTPLVLILAIVATLWFSQAMLSSTITLPNIASDLCYRRTRLQGNASEINAQASNTSSTTTQLESELQPVKLVDQVVVLLIDAMRPDFVLKTLQSVPRNRGKCVLPSDYFDKQHSLEQTPAKDIKTANTHEEEEEIEKEQEIVTNAEDDQEATLTYIENSLRNTSEASVGLFLLADAPTTTGQRVKAIGTGSIPAYLEAGSNFNAKAVVLDTIMRQLNGSAVLLGDNTWTSLFPSPWRYTNAIESLEVADFDTNDDLVLSEIYHFLENEVVGKDKPKSKIKRKSDPHSSNANVETNVKSSNKQEEQEQDHVKLIIGHFLGVDHIGHRHYARHPAMSHKLRQLNEMIVNVTNILKERSSKQQENTMRTLLFILGDHGMTNSGDHGGNSHQETDTFLFAQYFGPTDLQEEEHELHTQDTNQHTSNEKDRNNAKAQTASLMTSSKEKAVKSSIMARWMESLDEPLKRYAPCRTLSTLPEHKISAAFQIDLTATITTVLGRPIPFSSFGRVIPEIVALASNNVTEMNEVMNDIEQCNLDQLLRYYNASNTELPPQPTLSSSSSSSSLQESDQESQEENLHQDYDIAMNNDLRVLLPSAKRIRIAQLISHLRNLRCTHDALMITIGMMVLFFCVFSFFKFSEVRHAIVTLSLLENWTMIVFVATLMMTFANSYIEQEDVILNRLLIVMLLLLTIPKLLVGKENKSTHEEVKQKNVHNGKINLNGNAQYNNNKTTSKVQTASNSQISKSELMFLGIYILITRALSWGSIRSRLALEQTVEVTSVFDDWWSLHVPMWMQRNGVGLVCGCLMWMILENVMVPLIINRKYKTKNCKNRNNNNRLRCDNDFEFSVHFKRPHSSLVQGNTWNKKFCENEYHIDKGNNIFAEMKAKANTAKWCHVHTVASFITLTAMVSCYEIPIWHHVAPFTLFMLCVVWIYVEKLNERLLVSSMSNVESVRDTWSGKVQKTIINDDNETDGQDKTTINNIQSHDASMHFGELEDTFDDAILRASSDKTIVQIIKIIYYIFVLWCTALCNEHHVTSIITACFGVTLPTFVLVLLNYEPIYVDRKHLPLITQTLIIHLAMYGVYYLQGNQTVLSIIDWNAALVGIPHYNMLIGATLVFVRMYNVFLFTPLACAVAIRQWNAQLSTDRYVSNNYNKTIKSDNCNEQKQTSVAQESVACNTSAEMSKENKNNCNGEAATNGSKKADGNLVNCEINVSHTLSANQKDVTEQEEINDAHKYGVRLIHFLVHFTVLRISFAVLSVFILRNHLMLYTVFSPKLIFDTFFLIILCVGYFMSLLIL